MRELPAIYVAEMDKIGNADPTNEAGAAHGTSYYDGQCACDLKWVNSKGISVEKKNAIVCLSSCIVIEYCFIACDVA